MSTFKKLMADLEALSQAKMQNDGLMEVDNSTATVYSKVCSFLRANDAVPSADLESFDSIKRPLTTLNSSFSMENIGASDIMDFVADCGVPVQSLGACASKVQVLLDNASSSYQLSDHFREGGTGTTVIGETSDSLDLVKGDLEAMYPNLNDSSLQGELEAFGASSNDTLSDVKVSLTVSILRYHRSTMQRILPSVGVTSNVIRFPIDHVEVYDLAKSRDSSAAIRYGSHRQDLVELYNDPNMADTTPKKIMVYKVNDDNSSLIDDGIVKLGSDINMFSLGVSADTDNGTTIDWTDLVGDGVNVAGVTFEVANADRSTVETFTVKSGAMGTCRLISNGNNRDSGDRSANIAEVFQFSRTQLLLDGSVSTLLDPLSEKSVVTLATRFTAGINLKTSQLFSSPAVVNDPVLGTTDGSTVLSADKTAVDALTFTAIGFVPDAKYTEENLRRTTSAIRVLSKEKTYEIAGSKNYAVQSALGESRPGPAIDAMSRVMALGNDTRSMTYIEKGIDAVGDRSKAELISRPTDPSASINNEYVAGQRVKAWAIRDSFDATDFTNMRSSEEISDRRAAFELKLLDVITALMNRTFYQNELHGQRVVMNCYTSGHILNSLFAVPHMHTGMDGGKVVNGDMEFQLKLPNGMIINVATTTFSDMSEKIVLLMNRPGQPSDTMNTAVNFERGTFIAKASQSQGMGTWNTMIGNQREMPIVLCPVGAILDVVGLPSIDYSK